MATLFNTKISQTYQGLLKTIDNAALTTTLRELTDGLGNQSGLYLNKSGDFKVTAILEWGSLKDTGTGVTITQFVTAANGIGNYNNDTTVPTSAAVKLYVDTKFSQTDTLQEVLTFGNTTSGTDIAVSANDDITFTDSSKILMGASSDLQIYHDGSNSYIIDAGTGGLTIQANADFAVQSTGTNENFITAATNAFVKLYFNGNEKLATTNTGVDVTGNLVVSGTITGSGGSFLPLAGGTMTGDTNHGDNVGIRFGASNDLFLFHDGNNSFIDEAGTGSLYLRSATNMFFQTYGSGKKWITLTENAGVELFYNDSKKLETTSAGATVSGDLTVTGSITGSGGSFLPLAGGTMTGDIALNDGVMAKFGTGSDLLIYHDGSNSYIKDQGTGSLKILAQDFDLSVAANNASMIKAVDGGQVELYYGGAKKFETTSTGVSVTGNLTSTSASFTGDVDISDSGKLRLGDAQDLQIYHQGANSFIDEVGTGNLYIRSGNFYLQTDSNENAIVGLSSSEIQLFHNGSEKLATKSTGIQVTGSVSASGNIYVPDNQYIYVGSFDLAMSHNGTDSIIRNYTGDFQINQGAVTKSIVFKVSDANALDTTALTISRNADASFGRNVTIAGDLTVNGTTTTINTQTLAVEDPLIEMAKDNAANSLDIGFYGKYNDGTARYTGLFMDASSGTELYRLFKGTTAQPTTTVDIGGTGYVAASLVVDGLFVNDYVVHNGDNNTKIGFNTNDNFEVVVGGNANITADTNRSYLRYQGTAMAYTDSTGVLFQENISLGDAKKLTFGAVPDYEIYHNDTTNVNHISSLIDRQLSINANIINLTNQANNSTYLQLASTGATFSGDVSLLDSKQLKLGNGEDLLIFHDGANSYVKDNGTGNLLITSNGASVQINKGTTENMAEFITDGAVKLYYDSVKKFETTSTGVSVTGGADTQAVITGTTTAARLDIKTNSHHRFLQTIESDGRFRIYNQTTTTEQFTIKSTGQVGVGTDSPTAKFEIQSPQLSTQFDRDCFLRLHPTTSIDSGGFTNMFFGTSPVNNYGVAIGGSREGTDGTPSFSIRMLDDSITGTEVFNISSLGDVTIGSTGKATDQNLNIFTGGSNSTIKYMEAGNTYGFSTVYAGGENKFHIKRHNNSASGSNVLSFNRDDDNATFAGPVLIDGVLNYTGLEIKGSGASRPSIQWSNATQGDLGSIFGTESNALVLTSGSGNATTLTLDSSNNATFAGDVISNAIVQANAFRTTTGSTDYSLLTRNSSNTAVYIQQAGSGDILDVRYGSQAAGQGTSAFSVNSSGNSTFTGNVNIQNASTPLLTIADSTNGVTLLQGCDNTNTFIRSYVGPMLLQTNGGNTALTLDASQTATFSGNVGVGGSPSHPLDVKGADTDGSTIARFYSNAGARGSFIIRNGSGVSPTTFIGTAGGSEQLSIGTQNTEAIRLDASQNLEMTGGGAIYGKNYAQTSSDSTFSIIDTGIAVQAGVWELYYMGNPNSGGSSAYRGVTTGLIIVTVDFSNPNVVNEIRFEQTSITGGGSSDINLPVAVKILQGGSEYNELNVSTSGQTIRVKVSGWAGTKGAGSTCRITRRL